MSEGSVQSSISEAASKAIATIQDFLKADVRFPKEVGNIFNQTWQDCRKGTYKPDAHVLPPPCWVPDSYIRSQKRNLYLAMLNASAVGAKANGTPLSFYKESGGGKITDTLKSIGASVITAVSNQIGAVANTAQSAYNAVNNAIDSFSSDSSSSQSEESITDPFLANQPYVKVYGINPLPDLSQTIEIVKEAWNIIKTAFNSDNGMSGFMEDMKKALFKAIKKVLLPTSTVEINSMESLWTAVSQYDTRMHSIVERLFTNSIQGVCMQYCKLPYIVPCKTFTSVTGSWDGGLDQEMGGAIAAFTGMQIGMVNKMKWTPSNISKQTPINIKFTMYNDTFEHLVNNFYFILGFTAGSRPNMDTIFIRPPYLYEVEVPGGGRFRLCECDSSFTPIGKMRKISDSYLKKLYAKSPWGEGNFKGLASEDLLYFPDAWEAEFTFKSALPDTWNFMAGYFFEKEDKKIGLGEELNSVLGEFMKSFSSELKAAKTAREETEKKKKAIEEAAKQDAANKAQEISNDAQADAKNAASQSAAAK